MGQGLNLDKAVARKVLNYWRASVADECFLNINEKKFLENAKRGERAVEFSYGDIQSGKLEQEKIEQWFLYAQEKRRKKNQEEEILQTLDVIVIPYRANLNVYHSKPISGIKAERVVFPVWIPARIKRNGELCPSSDLLMPWVNRCCLTPNDGFVSYPVIGDISSADEFYTQNGTTLPESTNWKELLSISNRLLEAVVEGNGAERFARENYKRCELGYVKPSSSMFVPTKAILESYDYYIEDRTRKLPSLFSRYASISNVPFSRLESKVRQLELSAHHLGQMDNKESLTDSQRVSLSHFLDCKDGDIFALNGPPGTGKTSFLKSVFATHWVKAALDKLSPPIIVSASTNNQAITNILDKLSDSKIAGQDHVSKRWISSCNTYGLYFAASRKKEGALKNNYLFRLLSKDSGSLKFIQSDENVEISTREFLKNAENHFSKEFEDVDVVRDMLHKQLVAKHQEYVSAYNVLYQLIKSLSDTHNEYGSLSNLAEVVESNERKIKKFENRKARLTKAETNWLKFKTSKPISLIRIFSALPVIGKLFYGLISDNIELNLKKRLVKKLKKPYTINQIDGVLSALSDDVTKTLKTVKKNRDEAKIKQQAIEDALQTWNSLCQYPIDQGNLDAASAFKGAENFLDTEFRYSIFCLAARYWESRWLLAFQEPQTDHGSTIVGKRKQFEHYAMLTPCIVTTLHSGPTFFKYKVNDDVWIPAEGLVDLLIIEEAGQVSPYLAGPMMMVSKKALVIGDVMQISPVSNIPVSIDQGNARKFGVAESRNDYNELKAEGVLASGDPWTGVSYGSVMGVAQRRSKYKIEDQSYGGLYLAEHWRSVPKIMSYSNELCYEGSLLPMRKEIESIYPCFSYAHVKGQESRLQGSRENQWEAQVIANWIQQESDSILTHYRTRDPEKAHKYRRISDCIGVITPFRRQANTIQYYLKGLDFSGNSIGTIHSFQGAEKPIILFSMVHSSDSNQRLSFDKSNMMLNVAVSRAEDVFIAFGDMGILDTKLSTPSGLLAKYLLQSSENEILNIPLNESDYSLLKKNSVQLSSLDEHRRYLRDSILKAKRSIQIVSPYLTLNAINSDNIDSLIREKTNEVKVEIFTDPDLNSDWKNGYEESKVKLLEAGASVYEVSKVHSKLIAVDNLHYAIGSFNWLSASRNLKFARHEDSLAIAGEKAEALIKRSFDAIRKRVRRTR